MNDYNHYYNNYNILHQISTSRSRIAPPVVGHAPVVAPTRSRCWGPAERPETMELGCD